MKIPRSAWTAGAVFALLAIYLFASAPPPLPDGNAAGGRTIPAEAVLALLDAENAAIRGMYTRDIVGEGSRQGLAFREDWKKPEVAAGPLPALLLRETASRLQVQVPELSLFLGSDHPLVRENLFKGEQARRYEAVRKTLQPQVFYDVSLGRVTAMFPDRASAAGCVSCHNTHPAASKKDWVLNDVMGATTWAYSGRQVSTETTLRMVAALRSSAVDAYAAYLRKVGNFDAAARPAIGDKWPRDGFFLPDRETFRQAIENRNSAATLEGLLAALSRPVAGKEQP